MVGPWRRESFVLKNERERERERERETVCGGYCG